MGDSNDHTVTTSNDTNKDDVKSFKQDFSEDEESLIARMFSLVGERWSLIAGRVPGRTAEEIEKYWTSKYNNSSSEI